MTDPDRRQPDDRDPSWADALGVAAAVLVLGAVVMKFGPLLVATLVVIGLASCVLM
jgi:hypothetical protein